LDYPDVDLQVTMNAIITAPDRSNLEGGQLLLITINGFGEVYLHLFTNQNKNKSL
jgi:hypothetical protein